VNLELPRFVRGSTIGESLSGEGIPPRKDLDGLKGRAWIKTRDIRGTKRSVGDLGKKRREDPSFP